VIIESTPVLFWLQAIMEKFLKRDMVDQNKQLNISYDFFNVDTIVNHYAKQVTPTLYIFISIPMHSFI
jgi:hypothetical protein